VSSFEPDESGGQVNAGQKASCGRVVASGNGPELLEPGEEVLDQMSGLVEIFDKGAGRLAGSARWDHRHLASFSERLEHALVRIKRFVGNERLGFKLRQQGICSGQIVLLTAGQMEADRVAECIHQRVDLGGQSALAAANSLVLAGFLGAPAAC
jgi:hypothetical protein